MRRLCLVLSAVTMLPAFALAAEPIGQIKTGSGSVTLTHEGRPVAAGPGDRVYREDVLTTGPDGAVGITFDDNSMMSLGPNSELALDQFSFDRTTHQGSFDSSLRKGTLAVKSGQIVQETPEAMHIRTPAMILGVRGTEFVVRAEQ